MTGVRGAAAVILAGIVLSGPGAMLAVTLVAPQPAWAGVDAFVDAYHPIQAVPYVLGLGLLSGFVWFLGACHAGARPEERTRTSAAMLFGAVYAALVFTNYVLQVAYVPRILASRGAEIAALTMASPASFAWFLEMFGYAALGVATWLVAVRFGGSPRARAVRWLLALNAPLSIVGAVCTALWDRWVFSTGGLISFFAWNGVVAVCFALIAADPLGALERPEPPGD